MRSPRVVLAIGAFACLLVPDLAAQSKGQGIAIMPFAGYSQPGTLAEEQGQTDWTPRGMMFVGAEVQFGLSKNMSLGVGGGTTISGKMDFNDNTGTSVAEGELSLYQFYGSLIIRPGGRRPNGGVTPLFFEVGGGMTMYHFGNVVIPGIGAGGTINDANASKPYGFGGVGYNLPIGPRATLQLFGRVQAITAYSSQALDDFNTAGPFNAEGKLAIGFQAGAGLRFGR